MKTKKQYIPVLSFLIAVIALTTMFSTSVVMGDEIIDSVHIRVPVSCTISSSIKVGEEHNANIANGVYKTEIGTTNLKVICNDNTGFSVYAIGFTGDIHGNTVLSSSLSPSYDIITGIAEDGNTSNWAMKINTESSTIYDAVIENSFNDYSAVPSKYTKVATRNAGTDAGPGAIGSSLKTTYAVYIDKTQPSGSYIGQVKYILVHPNDLDPPQDYETESGYIGYYPNATSYIGTMERQIIQQTDTSATLNAPSYSREGYGFAGWNDKYDYTGNYYGPNEEITFEAGTYSGNNKGLSLYAVWVKSEGNLQDWQGCSSLFRNEVTALTDSRDNNTYAVAKLADNQCWTIENMRLNSDVSAADISSGSASIGENFTTIPVSSSDWDMSSASLTKAQFNNSNLTDGKSSYGGFYSWPTVIASSEKIISGGMNPSTSICPKGWRLPKGGEVRSYIVNDYYNLMKTVTGEEPNMNQTPGYGYYSGMSFSADIRRYPNNYVLSGQWNGNSTNSLNEAAFYWTSTTYDGNSAYYFYLDSSIVRPGNGRRANNKNHGNTFRCIANS